MERFTNSLRKSVEHGDWYVALTMALTLPDICGRIQCPGAKSQPRYVEWFNHWLAYQFKRKIGPDRFEHTFMSGDDLYALRCSYLHQGDVDITTQRAQQQRNALDRFVFVVPPEGCVIHLNQSDRTLQLQVSIFCEIVADAVDRWYASNKADSRIAHEVQKLLVIQGLDGGPIAF
jgi:hypothetical protein